MLRTRVTMTALGGDEIIGWVAVSGGQDDQSLWLYGWTASGWGPLMPAPLVAPSANFSRGVRFTQAGLTIALDASPYVEAFDYGDLGIVGSPANPSFDPQSAVKHIETNSDGSIVFCGFDSSPGLAAYQVSSSGFGARAADPVGSVHGDMRGIAVSPNDDWIITLSDDYSPYIHLFPWGNSTGFGTRFSGPPGWSRTSPDRFEAVAAHPDGDTATAFLAEYSASPSEYELWTWPVNASTGWGPLVQSLASPHGRLRGLAFSPDGNYIILMDYDSPWLHVYNFSKSTGIGSYVGAPAESPGDDVTDVAWNADGTVIFCSTLSSPYVCAYDWDAGFGDKYDEPFSVITISGVSKSATGIDFKAIT